MSDTATFISKLFVLDPVISGAANFINVWSILQERTEINATLFIMTIADNGCAGAENTLGSRQGVMLHSAVSLCFYSFLESLW